MPQVAARNVEALGVCPNSSSLREKLRDGVYHPLALDKYLLTSSDCVLFQTVALLSVALQNLVNARPCQLSEKDGLEVSPSGSNWNVLGARCAFQLLLGRIGDLVL